MQQQGTTGSITRLIEQTTFASSALAHCRIYCYAFTRCITYTLILQSGVSGSLRILSAWKSSINDIEKIVTGNIIHPKFTPVAIDAILHNLRNSSSLGLITHLCLAWAL